MPPRPILYGPDGQPLTIDRGQLTTPLAVPTVTGVRSIWADHPAAGLTPGRLAGILRAAEQGDPLAYLELAEDIEERWWHYRGVITTRKLSVGGLPWSVEAASDSPQDQKAAALVREVLDDIGLPDLMFDLLDGIAKGHAVAELIWETGGREWRPTAAPARDPRWFQLDRLDGTTLRLHDGSAAGADLTYGKWIIHRPRTKTGIPIRGGLARPAAWAFLFSFYGLKDWVSFLETYGQPLRLGRYGPAASAKDINTLFAAVRQIAADAAAVIPESMQIDFVRAEGASANADMFKGLIEHLERSVSKLVLGQTTTTDAVSGGHAVAQEHRLVQEDIERADARQLAATLRRDLLAPLVRLNFGPEAVVPVLRLGREAQEDLALTLTALEKLVPMGLKVSASVVRDRFGLPDPAEGEELLGAPSAPLPPADPAAATATLAVQADAGGDGPDAADRLVDAMLADWQPVADLADAVADAAAEAASADDFVAALARIAATHSMDDLVETLARGTFAARLAARVGG